MTAGSSRKIPLALCTAETAVSLAMGIGLCCGVPLVRWQAVTWLFTIALTYGFTLPAFIWRTS